MFDLDGYRAAVELLTVQIGRVRKQLKLLDGFQKAVEVKRYKELASIRKDLLDIIDYLSNYYARRFSYGKEKRMLDYGCPAPCRKQSYGDFSRLGKTDSGTEAESFEGDAK